MTNRSKNRGVLLGRFDFQSGRSFALVEVYRRGDQVWLSRIVGDSDREEVCAGMLAAPAPEKWEQIARVEWPDLLPASATWFKTADARPIRIH